MELKVDVPALAGQDIDPNTFQRVWNRVMPGQEVPAARNDAVPPDTVPGGGAPDEPSVPPAEPVPPEETEPVMPSVPECPVHGTVPECPAMSPVPDCPTEPVCPDCPSCPPQVECPACPECPTCPSCPPQTECPACPECPSVPSQPICPPNPGRPQKPGPCPPVLCLGESSLPDSGQLEELMALAREGALAGRALARRASGACARAMSALASDHRLAFRRLSASYFLITGKRCMPKCSAPCLPSSLPLALRQQFGWEQQWEQKNCQAAQAASDPCLKELYLELAQEGAFHAGAIRSILEQLCS